MIVFLEDTTCVKFHLPIIDEPINALLSQLPPGFVIVVVISPAEHHQAFGLGISNEAKVLQQLLSVGTDSLGEQHMKSSHAYSSKYWKRYTHTAGNTYWLRMLLRANVAHQDIFTLSEADGDLSGLAADVHQLGILV